MSFFGKRQFLFEFSALLDSFDHLDALDHRAGLNRKLRQDFFVETRKKGEDGINGGLMPRKMPDQPFMNYISVDSIDKFLQKVEQAGGVVVMPKTEIGTNMGWIAAFKDTEGNIMGFHEVPKKPAAKKAPIKKAAAKK